MLPEPSRLPRFMLPDHFASIYEKCNVATLPAVQHVTPGDWWRSLIVFAYLTGWRISEILKLKRRDLDLETGTAITRHADNKGNRDDVVRLHPIAIEHLGMLQHFGENVLPWPHGSKKKWEEFHRIQRAAGIELPCDDEHEHTPACHVYGFHDVRRAFATQNAGNLSDIELQALMRHKSWTTTQRYINMARQLHGESAAKVYVPDVLRKEAN